MRLPGLCSLSYEKGEIVPDRLCYSLKLHPWVTKNGAELLPTEDENCTLVEVTEEEVENSVKHIPSLATVVSTKELMVYGCTVGSTLLGLALSSWCSAEGQKHWAGLEQRSSLSWKQVLQDTWVSQGLSSSLDIAVLQSAEEYFRAVPKVTVSGLLVFTLELAA